jgi:imidazolonepropionase-like amidohydrolase
MTAILSRLTLCGVLLLLVGALGLTPATAQIHPGETPGTVAFVDVNVIPMDREHVLRGQTVVVENGRIAAVGPAGEVTIPADARRIEASGQYLIPGLAEMHGHIPGPNDPPYAEGVLFLYISNGVTTVRGMAGHPYHLELRDRVAQGQLSGPTIYAAGPGFGGHNASTPETPCGSSASSTRPDTTC